MSALATLGWRRVLLGGVSQWISIRGKDAGAPVVVVLHGGPGASEYAPRRKYLAALEDRWIVVDWDQRGAGRSFRGDENPTHLTMDRLVRDGTELVERLCEDLRRDQLVLVGHSFGSLLGVRIAQRIATRIRALVGTGQIVNWALQEERSYDWALAQARRRRNAKAIAGLERVGRPVNGMYAGGILGLEIERRWLARLGGVARDPSFVWSWILSLVTCPSYPVGAKLHYVKAMRNTLRTLWPELAPSTDLMHDAIEIGTPVHQFAGRLDRITDVAQVEAWHAKLSAPEKRLEVVDDAGHTCLYEAPARFIRFLEPLRGRPAA